MIPFGFVIFVTAFNELFILQDTGGSRESIITSWVLLYTGLALIVGAVFWIVLVLVARRTIV
jgi:hypothetical protein